MFDCGPMEERRYHLRGYTGATGYTGPTGSLGHPPNGYYDMPRGPTGETGPMVNSNRKYDDIDSVIRTVHVGTYDFL